jgi:thiamine-phosphate pyrophosphorylase
MLEATHLPIVAIGGIGAANAAEIIAAGASGVAVCGAVLNAADPGQAAADLALALPTGALLWN